MQWFFNAYLHQVFHIFLWFQITFWVQKNHVFPQGLVKSDLPLNEHELILIASCVWVCVCCVAQSCNVSHHAHCVDLTHALCWVLHACPLNNNSDYSDHIKLLENKRWDVLFCPSCVIMDGHSIFWVHRPISITIKDIGWPSMAWYYDTVENGRNKTSDRLFSIS